MENSEVCHQFFSSSHLVFTKVTLSGGDHVILRKVKDPICRSEEFFFGGVK